jgi:hypothetical protein
MADAKISLSVDTTGIVNGVTKARKETVRLAKRTEDVIERMQRLGKQRLALRIDTSGLGQAEAKLARLEHRLKMLGRAGGSGRQASSFLYERPKTPYATRTDVVESARARINKEMASIYQKRLQLLKQIKKYETDPVPKSVTGRAMAAYWHKNRIKEADELKRVWQNLFDNREKMVERAGRKYDEHLGRVRADAKADASLQGGKTNDFFRRLEADNRKEVESNKRKNEAILANNEKIEKKIAGKRLKRLYDETFESQQQRGEFRGSGRGAAQRYKAGAGALDYTDQTDAKRIDTLKKEYESLRSDGELAHSEYRDQLKYAERIKKANYADEAYRHQHTKKQLEELAGISQRRLQIGRELSKVNRTIADADTWVQKSQQFLQATPVNMATMADVERHHKQIAHYQPILEQGLQRQNALQFENLELKTRYMELDKQAAKIMPKNQRELNDLFETGNALQAEALHTEAKLNKVLSHPARSKRLAKRDKPPVMTAEDRVAAKYGGFLDARAEQALQKLEKARSAATSGMTEKDWNRLWPAVDSSNAQTVERLANAFNRLHPNIKMTTEQLQKAAQQGSQYMRVMKNMDSQIGQHHDLLQKHPASSKQYRILESDVKRAYDIMGRMMSDDKKLVSQATREWKEHSKIMGESRRRVDKMSKSIGFAGSKLGRFSIIMSGIAATLFVWQEFSRIIAAIIRPVTDMEKVMSQLKLEAELSGDQMERLSDLARDLGTTGYIKPLEFISSVRDLRLKGVQNPEQVIADVIERQQEAGKGTFDAALKGFAGAMRTWSETNLRGVTEDLRRLFEAVNAGLLTSISSVNKVASEVQQQRVELAHSIEHAKFVIKSYREFDPRLKVGNPLGDLTSKPNWLTGILSGRIGTSDIDYGPQRPIAQEGMGMNFMPNRPEHRLQAWVDDFDNMADRARAYTDQMRYTNRSFGQLMHNLEGLDEVVSKASQAYKIHADVIYAVIKQESQFKPGAIGTSGEKGLMQLMEGTAKEMGVKNAFDVEENVMGGVGYLRKMLDKYGDLEKALTAYNWGPGKVDKFGWDNAPQMTKDYVARIMQTIDELNGSLGEFERTLRNLAAAADAEPGEILWQNLKPVSDKEAIKWSNQLSKSIEYAFKLMPTPLPGQFQEQDRNANVQLWNLRNQWQGLPPQEQEERERIFTEQMDFQRGQYLLGPAMRDFQMAYDKLGYTGGKFWENEKAKHDNYIKNLKERLPYLKEEYGLTMEMIDAIDRYGKAEIKNTEIRPRLKVLEDVFSKTDQYPDRLSEANVKKINNALRAQVNTLRALGGTDAEEAYARLAAELDKLDEALNHTKGEYDALNRSFTELGTSPNNDRLFELELQRLNRMRASDYMNMPTNDADKIYDQRVRALKTKMIAPSLDAFRSMHERTHVMSQEHYEKEKELIELEKQLRIDLTGDVVSAYREMYSKQHELQAQYLEGQEYESTGEGVYRGMQAGTHRLLAEQQTLAQRVSNTWVRGADNIAEAWDEGFFTFMRFEFDNLKDVGIGILEELRDVTTGILNDILKEYAATFIRSGLSSLFNLGGNGATTLSTGAIANKSGVVYGMASGGLLNEPVTGIGLNSGATYNLAENGPEYVVPKNKMGGGELGGISVSVPIQITAPVAKHTANRMRDEVESTVLRIIREEMR